MLALFVPGPCDFRENHPPEDKLERILPMQSALKTVRAVLERWLLLWLVALSVLAFWWDRWLSASLDPFLLSKPILKYFFAVTMLAIGSILPHDEIEQVLRRWPTVFTGTAIQYSAMPLLAYLFGTAYGLPRELLVGVMLVGAVPGAMASNVLTLVARGNVSYSVSLTTSATLVSPVVAPCVLWLALHQWVKFPVLRAAWELSWMVVLPVVVGHLLSRRFSRWHKTAALLGPVVANLTILWIIAVVVAGNRTRLHELDGRLLWALLGVNLGGYLAGWLGGVLLRLPNPMQRALTLEVGMQNAGLGTVLALELFKQSPHAAIPPALYTFGCMFTGTVLARVWAQLSNTG